MFLFLPQITHSLAGKKTAAWALVFRSEVHLIFIELFDPRVPSEESCALVGKEFFFLYNINV